MKKLKILWLNWRCWLNPAMGGAEVFTHEVAKRWVKFGHEVTLFTSQFKGCAKEEIADGVNIVRAGGRFSVYRQAKKLYHERFRDENFDVIVDEINTVPFFCPKFVSNGERVIALIHQLAREYWFYETPFPINWFGYYYLEDRWLRQYVDISTVTVSESTKRDLANIGFKHVSVLPEGLNFEPLNVMPEKNDKPVVVFSGRLKRAKRPDHAVRAFNIVREKIPDAELWIFGDGPFRKELEKIAAGNARFFGDLPSLERRNLVKRGWVLVNPSVREGWGLNIIEANALGVPCVAYNVPGLRDSVKDEETGLLVEAGDVDALAENLIYILENSHERTRIGVNALDYAKKFNWEDTALRFMKEIS